MNLKMTMLAVLAFLCCLSIYGQEKKYSQEYQMRDKEVPAPVTKHIKENYPTADRIKHYHEVYYDTIFIESEFMYRGRKYSLRFLNDTLHEVEIYIEFDEIPVKSQTPIRATLDSLFTKYRFLEIQEVNPDTGLHYEFNVKGHTKHSTGFYEIFIALNGRLMRMREIIIQPIPTHF